MGNFSPFFGGGGGAGGLGKGGEGKGNVMFNKLAAVFCQV